MLFGHCGTLLVQWPKVCCMLAINIITKAMQLVADLRLNQLSSFIDALKVIWQSELRFNLFSFDVEYARNGEHFAIHIEGDEPASVALGQKVAALFQDVLKALYSIRALPSLLKVLLDLARIKFQAFGLLPSRRIPFGNSHP